MEERVRGWEPGMPLPSIKGTRYPSYIRTLSEQNRVTTRERFFVPLHQMHTYLLLFYYIKCARLFSGFAQHSLCPCSCILTRSPPRGCSRPCWLLEQSLGCPRPQTVGDALSMDILPWRKDGSHSPNHARKCATSYAVRLTAQQCRVLVSLLEVVKTNLVYQTSATLLEPT